MNSLPSDPRCQACRAPFEGLGGQFTRTVLKTDRSRLNPRLCNVCDEFIRANEGGAAGLGPMTSTPSLWQTAALARTCLDGGRGAIPAADLQLEVLAEAVQPRVE